MGWGSVARDVTHGVLELLVGEDPAAGMDRAEAAWADTGDPALAATASFAASWTGDYARGTALAADGLAVVPAPEGEVRALCLATAALAAVGDPTVDGVTPWEQARALLEELDDPATECATLLRYLLTEAALTACLMAAATDIDAAFPDAPAPDAVWAPHPYAAMMAICRLRTAAFSGRIDDAAALLPAVLTCAEASPRLAGVVGSVVGLVHGKADQHAALLATLEVADRVPTPTRDFVDRGVLRLLGYGLQSAGELGTAAGLILRAMDGDGMEGSSLIDRALSVDLLVEASLEADDLDSAETWLAALEPIAEHHIVAPAAARARARRHLALGEPEEAIALLTTANERCAARGSATEVVAGELLLARARIAAQDLRSASRSLRDLVQDSDRAGYAAVRRAAEEVLAPAGRRLPPVAGLGWAALSPRETEVARAVLAGQEVEEIADALFLAPSTVRAHLSRVFHAFGVPTRIALLAAVGATGSAVRAPDLSPRQGEVAALVAAGRSNQQIADGLGISVKGVEKHVGDILTRWSARTRFDIARIWWAENA